MSLMVHQFAGDPWGPCSRCAHPAYHEIHQFSGDARDDAFEVEMRAAIATLTKEERGRLHGYCSAHGVWVFSPEHWAITGCPTCWSESRRAS